MQKASSGRRCQNIMNDPSLSLRASATLTWIMLIVYGIWSSIPFSFIVFYAGLQTVPADTMEAAMIDGASKWQRMRHVVVPHLNAAGGLHHSDPADGQFPRLRAPSSASRRRPTRGRSAGSSFNDLREAGNPLYGSAGATSMLDDHRRRDPAVARAGAPRIATIPANRRTEERGESNGHRRRNPASTPLTVISRELRDPVARHRVLPPFLWTLWGSFKVRERFLLPCGLAQRALRGEHGPRDRQRLHASTAITAHGCRRSSGAPRSRPGSSWASPSSSR